MNKIIFSLLTAMLAVAMLLPLTACNAEKSGETGTTAATTEANIPTEQPTEEATKESKTEAATHPHYGAAIPHTDAMTALKAKWENSNEAWKEKLDYGIFAVYYNVHGARKEDKYRIKIYGYDTETYQKISTKLEEFEIAEEDLVVYEGTIPYIYVFVTAEQIEIIAKIDGSFMIVNGSNATSW